MLCGYQIYLVAENDGSILISHIWLADLPGLGVIIAPLAIRSAGAWCRINTEWTTRPPVPTSHHKTQKMVISTKYNSNYQAINIKILKLPTTRDAIYNLRLFIKCRSSQPQRWLKNWHDRPACIIILLLFWNILVKIFCIMSSYNDPINHWAVQVPGGDNIYQ